MYIYIYTLALLYLYKPPLTQGSVIFVALTNV